MPNASNAGSNDEYIDDDAVIDNSDSFTLAIDSL